MNQNRNRRRGSALVVCTLAAAALSMAAIAIVRSGQHSIARVRARQSSDSGRHVAEGLTQRAISLLRNDPATSGTVIDPGSPIAGAWCELTTLSPTATQIRVYLYTGSSIPATDIVVDPTAL